MSNVARNQGGDLGAPGARSGPKRAQGQSKVSRAWGARRPSWARLFVGAGHGPGRSTSRETPGLKSLAGIAGLFDVSADIVTFLGRHELALVKI